MIEYITLEDLLEIVEQMGEQVRDVGLLASAVGRPQTTVFGEDAYPDLETKVAALMHSIARHHALVDGNKRLAWVAGRLMMGMNLRSLRPTDDAFDVVMALAAGTMEVDELSLWIRKASASAGTTTQVVEGEDP